MASAALGVAFSSPNANIRSAYSLEFVRGFFWAAVLYRRWQIFGQSSNSAPMP
jgi:hypothetical protein